MTHCIFVIQLESDLLSIKQKMKDLEVEYEILNSKLGEATERFDETVKGADEAERSDIYIYFL